MSGFYDRHYGPENGMNFFVAHGSQGGGMVNNVEAAHVGVVDGSTLDDIVNQNTEEMHRRRSLHPQYLHHVHPLSNERRASMLEFDTEGNHILSQCHYESTNPASNGTGMMPIHDDSIVEHEDYTTMRKQSVGNLTLDNQFALLPREAMAHPAALHASAPGVSGVMDFTMQYVSPTIPVHLNYSAPTIGADSSSSMNTVNMFAHPAYTPVTAPSPMHVVYPPPSLPSTEDGTMSSTRDAADKRQDMSESLLNVDMSDSFGEQSIRGQQGLCTAEMTSLNSAVGFNATTMPQSNGSSVSVSPPVSFAAIGDPVVAALSSQPSYQHHPERYMGRYSSSGFDMMRALMKIATRRRPQINIGAVDMSCAFVVCRVDQYDMPIVYCSDVFERLTGYTRHEILGHNCRFLQAPDGKVEAGVKRKYVDDKAAFYLKSKIDRRQEVQVSLINYRKGGQPFMNLLTMIPIDWDEPGKIMFYVGFQVDLVEQPNSVTNKNPDGTYAINYQRRSLPDYVLRAPEARLDPTEFGQVIGPNEVSTVLGTISSGESELSKLIWDQVLLENADDVIHVLSLKGLFLYLSPSCRKVLGYDAQDLIGTALSSICHPSDIVPVTRELKDVSSDGYVDIVYRIRRKTNGYTWFESHGCLHTELGKGKKYVILIGRERPVYAIPHSEIVSLGGIGDNEIWSKMSTSGMFLFISSNIRQILELQPTDLVGSSAQNLMRRESKIQFCQTLELARSGKRCSFRHEIFNKRGVPLQASTIIYPGDASDGEKPTFLIAQTKLLKPSSRAIVMSNKQRHLQKNISTRMMPTPPSSVITSSQQTTSSAVSPTTFSRTDSDTSVSTNSRTPVITEAGSYALSVGNQDEALISEDNLFDELKTTRSTSWQFELRQMEKQNRILSEDLQSLISAKKKRKRRKGKGQIEKNCANCHTRQTPEWRRGPSGNRDLCNSCGLRWAKQNGRISPRTSHSHSDKQSISTNSAAGYKGKTATSKTAIQAKTATNKGTPPAKAAKLDMATPQAFGSGIPAPIQEQDEPEESASVSAAT